jgi:hypothetical protein
MGPQQDDRIHDQRYQTKIHSNEFRRVELAPMKNRSLPASVCPECSFLLNKLHKAPRGSQFLQ